ncbi:MAG: hypothetical protein MI824_21470 [Hyphomicrobiales bacterium]|nr:hypothetical protein [Hyphomicrobiales bacterium]
MMHTITHDIEELIARQVEQGNYESFDEVLAALKAFVSDDRLVEQARKAWLRREIEKGEASGGEIPAEQVFGAARSRIEAIKGNR